MFLEIVYCDYYPFGLQMQGRSSNSSNPTDANKFTSHERDDEANLTLDYMMARNHDPEIGRFLQMDPVNEFASPYAYVGNNPVNLIDPTGMYSENRYDWSGMSRRMGSSYLKSFNSEDAYYAYMKWQSIQRESAVEEVDTSPDNVFAINSGAIEMNNGISLSYTYNYKVGSGIVAVVIGDMTVLMTLDENQNVKSSNIVKGRQSLFGLNHFDKSKAGTKLIGPELKQAMLGAAFDTWKVINENALPGVLNTLKGYDVSMLRDIYNASDIDVYAKEYVRQFNHYQTVWRIKQTRVYGSVNGRNFVFENQQIKEYINK